MPGLPTNIPAVRFIFQERKRGYGVYLKCPHLGCAIDYRKNTNDYFCPCHNSTFGLDGSVTTENGQAQENGYHGYKS